MAVSKKIALIKRWLNIIFGKSATAVAQNEGRYYLPDEIEGYYNDLTLKNGKGTELDQDNIPVSELADGDKVHFPIAIFQYGLAQNDLYIETKDERYLESLAVIADWAVKNQSRNGSWDAFGPMKSSKYTVSAMCQGEGASLLFRAAKRLNDDRYRRAAFKAVDFMLKPIEKGGTSIYEGDCLYLEEYPEKPRRSVLNGWIFSAFGLYDASILDPKYREYFDRTIDTMCIELKNYDTGYWSLYDRNGKIASPAYHDLHISLLKVLAYLTKRNEFGMTCAAFENYRKNPINVMHAVIYKLTQKLTEDTDVVTVK